MYQAPPQNTGDGARPSCAPASLARQAPNFNVRPFGALFLFYTPILRKQAYLFSCLIYRLGKPELNNKSLSKSKKYF